MKPKNYSISVLTIISVVHFAFLIYSVINESYLIKDSFEYLHAGENIFSGYGWYSGDLNNDYKPNLESRRPPLYPFIAGLLTIIFKTNIVVLFLQNILSLINFAGLAILFKEFKVENRYISATLLLLLFFPSQFIFSNMLMAEILFQSCIFWSFFFIVLFLLKRRNSFLIWHSILLTLAVLTKPVLYLIWVPELLFFAYLFLKKKINFLQIFLSIIPLIAVLVINFYNEKKTGYFHYSSMKATNLMAYNVYQTLRINHSENEAKKIISYIFGEAETSGNFKEFSQTVESSGMKIIKENLGGYLFLTMKGMINFFIDMGRHDMYLFFDKDFKESEYGISYYYKKEGIKGVLNYMNQFSPLLIFYSILIIIANVFIFIALILFIFNKNIQPEVRIYTLIIIFYIAGVTGLIGSARFKLPVYPVILFTIPFFIDKIKNYKRLKWL